MYTFSLSDNQQHLRGRLNLPRGVQNHQRGEALILFLICGAGTEYPIYARLYQLVNQIMWHFSSPANIKHIAQW